MDKWAIDAEFGLIEIRYNHQHFMQGRAIDGMKGLNPCLPFWR